jgi:hypothetical protein
MDKKKLLIIGGVAVVGIVGYLLYARSKNKAEATTADGKLDTRGGASMPVIGSLKWVTNPSVASHLSGVLSDEEALKLRNWVNIIVKERKADPSKWGASNGLSGQTSDIGHALFQMDKQLGTSGKYWNDTNRYALQDA